MTRERQDILQDFYQADTKTIQVTIYNQNDTLKDLTGAEITYSLIKDDAKNPVVIFQKSSNVGVEEIEVIGLGVCAVHLLPTDTFNIHGSFRHQLHVHDSEGHGGIVMSGKVQIFRSFARRPRSSQQTAYLTGA